jgi:CRISPR-associated protein Cmr3
MSTKILRVKPQDTLFFGSGKVLNKGENSWSGTKLVPYPSVFYGAICTLMLSKSQNRKNKYIDNKNQDSDPRKFLEIKAIYLYDEKNKEILIPAPLDLYLDKLNKIHYANIKKSKFKTSVDESLKKLFFKPENIETKKVENMFVSVSNLNYSYSFYQDSIDIYSQSNINNSSYKVGIEIDRDTKTAKEKMLYRIDLNELKENIWSYLVEYEIRNDWEENFDLNQGYLKLGGENKVCKYFTEDKSNYIDLTEEVYSETNKSNYIKIVFISPSIFKNKEDIKKDIKAYTNSKPYLIGGYDMKEKKPKPMKNYIPEGSVYILKNEKFKNKTISEIEEIINREYFEKEDQIIGYSRYKVIFLSKEELKEMED